MKRILLIALAALTTTVAKSQDLKHCGADELRINTLKSMPEVAKAVIRRDEELEKFTQKFIKESNQKDAATYVIPVVFHVIHNYGPENISNDQIYNGIEVLNNTFRKLLADTADIIPAFKPIHADTKIEFRLAQKDPDGNCHSGINRIASTLTSKGDHSVKDLIHWPQNKYLNIYIVANAAGLAGHCVWPSDADTIPRWDGIVVGYNYVGEIGASDHTRSVALAHECGHYLNLHHIWGGNNVPNFYFLPCGDPNKDCNIDDLVEDTPRTIGWQSCKLDARSCNSPLDNVQNVMDYSYCNRMFTFGQRDRMQACLNSPIAGRNNLWTDANLMATGTKTPSLLCEADFTSDRTIICTGSGNVVNFSNTSYGTGNPLTLTWTFEGGTPSSSSDEKPVVAYSQPGTYKVELHAFDGVSHHMVEKPAYITVLDNSGSPYPYQESFESLTTLTGSDWTTSSLDESSKWEITNTAAYTGQKSIKLNNYSSAEPTSDFLHSKAIDLSGASGTVRLTFRYAYSKLSSADQTQVNVFFAGNCNSGWQKRSQISSLNLATADIEADFVPSGQSEWKMASVNIPSSFFTSDFHFRIELSSGLSNNLYLDDFNVQGTSGIDLQEIESRLQVYPNPASDKLTVLLPGIKLSQVNVKVIDVLGVEVNGSKALLSDQDEMQLDLSSLANGLYFISIETESGKVTRSFVVQK